MKASDQFDDFVSTINEMLQRCHDALDPKTPQAERNKLRAAIATYLKPKDTVREA